MVEVVIDDDQVNPPAKITVVIEYSCTFWVWYNLLTSLTPDLAKQALPGPSQSSALRPGSPGFIVPEHYAPEVWKIRVADPFN